MITLLQSITDQKKIFHQVKMLVAHTDKQPYNNHHYKDHTITMLHWLM